MSKILTLIFAGFLCSLNIQAQTNQIADTLQFEEVVVTASKIPTALRETSKPVIIIDQEIIARSSGKDLSQLLSEQAGILVNGAYSNPGKDKSLFVQGAASKYTLFLVDGLAVNDPNGLGGASDLRNFPLDNIERIEVVKGSMSTLYGTDAISGVVNIITKKASENQVQLTGATSYGSFGTYKGALGINGTQSGSSYSINFAHDGSDGISEAKDTTGSAGFDKDGFERNALNLKAGVSPVEGLEIKPYFNYTGFDGDYDGGSFTDGAETYESTFINPGVHVTYENGAFKLNTGYNYTSSKLVYNSAFGTTEFRGKLQNLDVYGTYKINEFVQSLAGINYQRATIEGEGNAVENPISELYSPYVTTSLRNFNGINAEVGLRLNSHSEYGDNITYSFAGSYYIFDEFKLLTSLGTGFRAPIVSELFGAFGANPNLDPEESIYFNAGAEVNLMGNTLRASLNYFYRDIDNVIIYTFPAGYINQNRQQDKGVELSASYFINEKVSVSADYTYLIGELTSEDFEGNKVKSDNLYRRPTHSVGVGVNVQPIEDLTLQLQGTYLGERKDLFFNNADFSSSEVTLSAHPLLNFYANYQLFNGMLNIFTDIKNILDTDYTEVYGFNTVGLSAKLGLRFNLQ